MRAQHQLIMCDLKIGDFIENINLNFGMQYRGLWVAVLNIHSASLNRL